MNKILLCAFIIGGATALTASPSPALAEGGHLQVRSCPFSCRSEGIDKRYCRDWRRGNLCYVEDLRKPAGRHPGHHKPHHPTYPLYPEHRPTNGHSLTKSCYGPGTRHLPIPQVQVKRVLPTGRHRQYLVSGTLSGTCLTEAGYYEKGREKYDLPVYTRRDSIRIPFSVEVRSNKSPEIRVRNSRGGSQHVSLTRYIPSHDYGYDEHGHHDHNHHGPSCSHDSHYQHPGKYPYRRPVGFRWPWLRNWKHNTSFSTR